MPDRIYHDPRREMGLYNRHTITHARPAAPTSTDTRRVIHATRDKPAADPARIRDTPISHLASTARFSADSCQNRQRSNGKRYWPCVARAHCRRRRTGPIFLTIGASWTIATSLPIFTASCAEPTGNAAGVRFSRIAAMHDDNRTKWNALTIALWSQGPKPNVRCLQMTDTPVVADLDSNLC